MRTLARRYARSKHAVMKIIHHLTHAVKTSEWIAARFHPCWLGILVVDGKYIRVFDAFLTKLDPALFSDNERRCFNKKVWLCGIDSGTGDLPHYTLADEETKIDLILYFQTLKKIGYILRVLVCDGNDYIVEAGRKVYGDFFLVQRCARHFLEGLRRRAQEAGMGSEPKTLALIDAVKSVIEARSLEEAHERYMALRRQKFLYPLHREIIAALFRQINTLTTHLQHPVLHIPHTTNEIENLFRQVNLRLRSLGRFGHWRYANDYLNAWALWGRFTPFTDCRGERRKRNGKTPLELAGCKVVDIDFLSL